MGVLSSDMTRLCGEIGAMRKMRGAFMKELKHETKGRRAGVSDMRENFSTAHADMARKMKADCLDFVSNLRQVVGGLRRTLRADLAGARRAWLGLTRAESTRVRRDEPEESPIQRGRGPKGKRRSS